VSGLVEVTQVGGKKIAINPDAVASVQESFYPYESTNYPCTAITMTTFEVREDGIYALFPQSVIDLIEDARREDRERRESMLIFGTPEPPERYAYTSPVMEALPRTPRAAGHRITGKRAQRRMSKPWAGRRA